MTPRFPERNKKPGVCYAVTDDGLELPVIDVTHPSFAVEVTPAEIATLRAATLEQFRKMRGKPAPLMWIAFRILALRSRVMRGLARASGTFLDAMTTYLMKLGADNLGAYASPLDRRIVGSPPNLSIRLRLRDTARLLAEGLGPALAARPGAPLWLINIAGGPAVDSLNALILIRRADPSALAGRPVSILVFDLEPAGPNFGARGLAALQAEGAPLHGANVSFQLIPYDWRATTALRVSLGGAAQSVCAVSSEGGLFDYGSDEEIVANLEVLRDVLPASSVVVGSISPDQGHGARSSNQPATRPRNPDAFEALVRRAGWTTDTRVEEPVSHTVRLRRIG